VSAALVEELRAEVESLRELARGATATALAQATELAVLRAQLAPLLAVHDALVAAAALPGAGASGEAMVAAVRAKASADAREDLARIGRLVGCDSLVGVEIHAAVEHELLERDAARDAAERAERERDDALAEVETMRAEHALAMERVRELEKELGRLRRGVVANAGRTSVGRKQRWAYVMDAVGCGSTRAAEMCVVAGFDPEGECGIEPDDEDERGGES
jgi:hypothetical protein